MNAGSESPCRAGSGESAVARRFIVALALAIPLALYLFRLGDVPLLKFDEWWGAQASWEIWQHGRFSLPGFAGHLREEERTFFHPPGFYLLNAPIVGLLGLSPASIRVLPSASALASFAFLYALLRSLLRGLPALRRSAGAALGVLLFALNPLTFAAARHTRPETLIVLLVAASVFLLRRALFESNASASSRAETSKGRALAAGLLSGYALFSHYWAYVVPVLVGLTLLRRRRLRPLLWYGLGVSVFVVAITGWIASNWQDFLAETRWLRQIGASKSAGDFLQRWSDQVIRTASHFRAQPVWLVDATGFAALALCAPSRSRRLLALLMVTIHALLLLFPRQSAFYLIAVTGAWAVLLPFVLLRLPAREIAFLGQGQAARLRWLLAAALLALQAGGLAYWVRRDLAADYAATLAPIESALDAADPGRAGIVVGSPLYYVALHEHPYLVRQNPSLWRLDGLAPADPEAAAAAILAGWRARGIRFVVLTSLVPNEEPLSHGALVEGADRSLTELLRQTSRLLATSRTFFYGGIEYKYRWVDIELWELSGSSFGVASNWAPMVAPNHRLLASSVNGEGGATCCRDVN